MLRDLGARTVESAARRINSERPAERRDERSMPSRDLEPIDRGVLTTEQFIETEGRVDFLGAMVDGYSALTRNPGLP